MAAEGTLTGVRTDRERRDVRNFDYLIGIVVTFSELSFTKGSYAKWTGRECIEHARIAFRNVCEGFAGKLHGWGLRESPKKHNRLYMKAKSICYGVTETIEDREIRPHGDPEVRGNILSEEFGWDKDLTKKIWCFGLETSGPNMFVDTSKGVEYLNEIKDSVVAGFS
ncbi:hypothetical protein L1887_31791 [Cichorium endivia]|nr:hypothetical protein L1887_31791 [Cichorium endivia]